MYWAVIVLIAGLLILWKSAELLVCGAVGLAKELGISPLIIGLTVVAMGTSAPEVAASIAGVLQQSGGGDLAIGNVFGSNIANLILVGALVALIRPLEVRKLTILREIPVMIAVGLLLWPLLHNDSFLSRAEAGVLLGVFVGLVTITIYAARRQSHNSKLHALIPEKEIKYKASDTKKSFMFVLIGLAGLALGAKMTVEGAVFVGKQVGLSEAVISLTVIAFGTSLPELVTCVVAAVKGQHDISVGNLVGSNIFNTLLVTGGAGIVQPFEVSTRFGGGIDYWIMIGVSVIFALAIIIGKRTLGRTAGLILLLGYFSYISYLLATGSTNI